MAILVLRGEKKLSDVVTRAYGDLKAADRKRAEEAILRANPQLANLRDAARGAVVVVPPVPGLRRDAARSEATTPAPDAVIELRKSLEAYAQRLDRNVDSGRQAVTVVTTLLASSEVKTLVRDLPGAAPHVERVTAAVKARTTQHEARADSLEVLAKARVELDNLARKLA
jgi:hypothetical protein